MMERGPNLVVSSRSVNVPQLFVKCYVVFIWGMYSAQICVTMLTVVVASLVNGAFCDSCQADVVNDVD